MRSRVLGLVKTAMLQWTSSLDWNAPATRCQRLVHWSSFEEIQENLALVPFGTEQTVIDYAVSLCLLQQWRTIIATLLLEATGPVTQSLTH